jgi:hypothetical protein
MDANLFTTYKDYYKNRNLLLESEFDAAVLEQLVTLAETVLLSDIRANRAALLEKINAYMDSHKLELPSQIRERIFNLVLLCEKQHKWSLYGKSRQLLKNLPLSADGEKWLCQKVQNGSISPNRILRYPVKSEIISQWVSKNYNNAMLKPRRAEAVSWLLNENPDFIVDNQTLIDDFEHINSLDKWIIEWNNNILNEGIEINNKRRPTATFHSLTPRPYVVLSYLMRPDFSPDFSDLRRFFHENLEKIKRQTMLWAVAYSHLDDEQKIKLIKQFYLPELYVSASNIAKKYVLQNLLDWLEKQPKNYYDSEFRIRILDLNSEKIKTEILEKAKPLVDALGLEIEATPF